MRARGVVAPPAPADSGISFVRTDVAPGMEIPALSSAVVDTVLNTSLGRGDVRIGTVELGSLKPGEFRFLAAGEVQRLMKMAKDKDHGSGREFTSQR